MANGTAAVRFLNAPSAPAPPIEKREAALIQEKIGEAVASAATGFCYALAEFQNGGLRPETRLANGERIAALYQLQQAHTGEISFEVVAREQGRRVLRQYLDADDFYRRHGPSAGDAIIDIAIDEVFTVLGKVTDFERRLAN